MNIYQQSWWSLYITTLEAKIDNLETQLVNEKELNKLLHNKIKVLCEQTDVNCDDIFEKQTLEYTQQ